ncbi:hypothetical protein ROZALSC1DRAFT_31759 [Rozella allomycis CSF55]|uniref:Peptidase A2 domain-containing protein n=1 Tax=Rozella allomycis (strain CSF55) TaxID=988480 RepID=A0A075B2A9_ROZAC|nr:hypothetical protein O9G_002331 [Rozella allomycis CSF55]RKP16211.1 hypothetical protein ROZALSC1DRAFT_31759 [Rozella allomycis CSF55]|eukprot:EPZ36720.1 hypothetical protein O9G_002331 [Rozella allomycis CSF55]
MINLACRRRSKTYAPVVKIIFLVDTGSPVTYLSKDAIEALIGKKSENLPSSIHVLIQQQEIAVECHMSPEKSYFADVNVLGINFLSKLGLTMSMDFKMDQFTLNK